MSNILRGLVLVLCAGTVVAQSSAQWIVHRLHPSGAFWSEGARTSGDQHVGRAQFLEGPVTAGLWNGSLPGPWISLHPAGATDSRGNDVSAGKQVGSARVGAQGQQHAVVWSGTANSYVDLHPPGTKESRAFGVSRDGVYQVGDVDVGIGWIYWRATLWAGTAASRVDLHPGVDYSHALAVGDGEQVGWTESFYEGPRAALWRGTRDSYVDLTPEGSGNSEARGVSRGQQVGWVSLNVRVAALWTGTSASFVNLNPAGASGSWANGVSNAWQIGAADFNGVTRAGYWRGTSESWTDLHSYLPGEYTSSHANGIAHLAGVTYIIGTATTADRREAVMWTIDSAFSVSLNAPSVVGGVVTTGAVTFENPASGRRLVRMSDNSDHVIMSTYCIVPANQATGTFSIWTYGVATTTVVTISADFLGTVQTANLILSPASLQILWLYPTAVVGGLPSMGNVRLIGKAPAGGATLALSSSNTTAANLAASTVIPWGASLAQFPISTFGVHTNSNAVISATYAGVTRTAVISVRIATPSRLDLGSNAIKGGTPVAAWVTMTGLAGPAGRTLVLSSNHPKIVVPPTLYVPPQRDWRGFWVQTQTVTSNTSGTITVSQGSITRTATLTLTP